MKNFTAFPLGHHKYKIVGIVTSSLSLIILFIVKVFGTGNPFNIFTDQQFTNILYWLFVFGLYMLATSKEKIDDERVEKIRSRSFRAAFTILLVTLISLSLVDILVQRSYTFSSMDLLFISGIALLIYIIIFYISYFFDPSAIYNNDDSKENIKKNKMFFLIYILSVVVILLIVLVIL